VLNTSLISFLLQNHDLPHPELINSPEPESLPIQNSSLLYLSDVSSKSEKNIQAEIISIHALTKLKTPINMLKIKIKRYDEQNKKKNKKWQEMQLKIDNQDCNTLLIEQIKADAENNNPKATFLLDQIINYNKQIPRWSEVSLRLCIAWRISSPKGYHYGRSLVLKLPSRSTLERYLGNGQEVTDLIEARLKTEADLL
jgi:hypothetical protein